MNSRLYQMAEYAYNNVSYYRERIKKTGRTIEELLEERDWAHIPLLEKEDVADHNNSMIADEYLGLYARDKLIRSHTSGSSGVQLDVYWADQSYYLSLLPLWMERWQQARIHPRDRVCYFNTCLEDDQAYVYRKNALIVSKRELTYNKLSGISNEIKNFEPKWLLLHPTIALMFCEIVESEHLEFPSICYIELTGEIVLDSLKRRLEEDFGCKVKCHYGTMEVNSIGYEIEKNTYRIFDSSSYVEIIDDEGNVLPYGEKGNIYVTSLQNFSMPFVRYGVGDTGILSERENQAGQKERVLKLCGAKKTEYILLENGERISADKLLEPLVWLGERGEAVVYQIQASQISLSQLEIRFALDEEIDPMEFLQCYMQRLDGKLRDHINIGFNFMQGIERPNATTGKWKWFRGM